jgi:MFS family permease
MKSAYQFMQPPIPTLRRLFSFPAVEAIAYLAISIIGAIQATFAAGAAFGALAQGWVGDWLGRKKALAAAGLWALVGGALATASQNLAMLIAVRFLHGFGLGMIICLVPLYITEVVSALFSRACAYAPFHVPSHELTNLLTFLVVLLLSLLLSLLLILVYSEAIEIRP